MRDSKYIELFYGFIKIKKLPNERLFYDKTSIILYFLYDSLEHIEDFFWCSLFGNYLLLQV